MRLLALTALVIGASVGLAVAGIYLFSIVDVGLVVGVGAPITTGLFFLFSRFIRVVKLSDDHACRGAPVQMLGASDTHVAFRFYNPLYADRFAESNGSRAVKATSIKAPRGASLVGMRTLATSLVPGLVIAGILQALAFGMIQEARQEQSKPTVAVT